MPKPAVGGQPDLRVVRLLALGVGAFDGTVHDLRSFEALGDEPPAKSR